MEVLDTRDELISDHQDRLKAERAIMRLKKVLQSGAEHIHHESTIIPFFSIPPDGGDCMCIGHIQRDLPVDEILPFKFTAMCQSVFNFDCNFLSSVSINSWKDASYSKVSLIEMVVKRIRRELGSSPTSYLHWCQQFASRP